ncbi:toxin-antitoxin system YwqK family antitoxin [Streptomyces sp. NPDC000345]|uniref:toxin-antitoxin system YwqK family antitoxin n=1 Tax=Streptomyces sp. NPDC000345 TaxID=3364537 RepID=UPI003697EEB7
MGAAVCAHYRREEIAGFDKASRECCLGVRVGLSIDLDDPEVDAYAQRLLYRGELFTGEVEEPFTGEVEEWLGGARVSLESYVDGRPDGPCREWYPDGRLRSEMTVRRGRAVGVSREWHPSGLPASERVFSEDGGELLARREWGEDGRPTVTWLKGDGG